MSFNSVSPQGEDPTFDDITYKCNINDCRSHGRIIDKMIHQISVRLFKATKMNPVPR